MKKSFLIFSVLILSCNQKKEISNDQINQAIFQSDTIEVKKGDVIQKNKNIHPEMIFVSGDSISVFISRSKQDELSFKLRINNDSMEGIAKLVLIENNGKFELPESTAILDENTNVEYFCDSIFQYESPIINLTFSLEKNTKKRMSFIVNNSKIKKVEDNFYTLYKK